MIISASRRTDIPAYYSEWFVNRIKEGFFIRVNPFNPKQRKAISIKAPDVDVIVFWTKNPRPLLKYLRILDEEGYRYYFQFTLNDYPVVLEPGVPPVKERIETFRELSEAVGKKRIIWRFDPIALSTVTSATYLQEKFDFLATELKDYTERVVISFLDLYRKVQSGAAQLAARQGIVLYDITAPEFSSAFNSVVQSFARTAARNNLEIFTCAERVDLRGYGIKPGKCIDDELIKCAFGISVSAKKDKAQRPECLCVEAVDMGMYNTCQSGCLYCYATAGAQAVKRNIARHDPSSPVLVGQCDFTGSLWDGCETQMRLF